MNIKERDIKGIEFGEPIEEREPNYRDGYIRGIYRAKNIIDSKQKEIERLNNIIKEVREYIEKLKNFKIKYVMFEEKELYASENDFVKELLEILDKGECK